MSEKKTAAILPDLVAEVEAELIRQSEVNEAALLESKAQSEKLLGGRVYKDSKETFFGFKQSPHESLSEDKAILLAIEREKQKNLTSKKFFFEKFSIARLGFQQKLSAVGIEPIAVLPKSSWAAICVSLGLLRFTHLNEKGITRFQTFISRNTDYTANFVFGLIVLSALIPTLLFMHAAWWLAAGLITLLSITTVINSVERLAAAWLWITLLSIAFCALVGEWIHYAYPKQLDHFSAHIASIFICGAIFMVGGMCYVAIMLAFNGDNRIQLIILSAKWQKILPKRWIYRLLWPRGCDLDRDDENIWVAVSFPVAPEQFVKTLRVLWSNIRCQPCIAAVPEAISINSDVAHSETLRQMKERRKSDPICYVEDGDFVVIISAYGDFQVEHRALQRARREAIKAFFASIPSEVRR